MKKILVILALGLMFSSCEKEDDCLICDKYKRRAVQSGNPEWDYVGMGKICAPLPNKAGGFYYTSEGKSYYKYGGCVEF